MKRSNAFGVLLFALAAPCLHASSLEVGVMIDKEVGKAQVLAAGANGTQATAAGANSVSPSGLGLRVAYNFLDIHLASIGAVVNYHPKAQGDLTLPAPAGTVGKYGNQYNSIGVQVDWKFLINLHAGVDYRSEKLTTTGLVGSDSTTLNRPWATVGVGFSAPMPIVSPFVRLEVAAPLSTSSNGNNQDDFRKAMAPSLQVALYGGIRF